MRDISRKTCGLSAFQFQASLYSLQAFFYFVHDVSALDDFAVIYCFVLRDVSQGEIFTVVSRGKPVATIAPVKLADAQRSAAKTVLVARLRKQEASGERIWTRDELYER